MTLDDLSALENLPWLQLRPPIHRPDLHTHHVLVPIFWLEVAHRLGLLDPRIPRYGVLEVVALDVEAGFAVVQDRGRVLLNRLVDAVDFAGDAEVGGRLLVFGCVEDFVDVGGAAEARDGGAGDVLGLRLDCNE